VAVYQSSPVNIINCTLRFNLATEQGGGLYSEFSDVAVTNSIVWGNTPDQIGYRGSSDVPVVTWSDVQGGYSGTGNINETPQFVNLLNAHLKGASPAIDAGTSTGAPTEDIDGDARPADAGVDMGADEYIGDVHPVPSITANGMGDVVTLDRSETPDLIFTFSLDNRGRTDPADWWIIFNSPAGMYFLTADGLTEEWTPFLQLPLFDAIAGYDYPPIPLAGMPLGSFTVFFAVDTDQDGLLSWTNLYYDWVRVNLTE
jgi:hypothetical protein